MASHGKYHCDACNASFPYPSKFRHHLQSRKHQLEVSVIDHICDNEVLMMNCYSDTEVLERSEDRDGAKDSSSDQPESEVSYFIVDISIVLLRYRY